MLTERQAKKLIISEWINWDGKSGTPSDKHAFYEWLRNSRPSLLNFRSQVDTWELIKMWLRDR